MSDFKVQKVLFPQCVVPPFLLTHYAKIFIKPDQSFPLIQKHQKYEKEILYKIFFNKRLCIHSLSMQKNLLDLNNRLLEYLATVVTQKLCLL